MLVNLRAWYLLLKLLISLSNELSMISTLILFFPNLEKHNSMKIEKQMKPRAWYLLSLRLIKPTTRDEVFLSLYEAQDLVI
jgi:hypothetical protein